MQVDPFKPTLKAPGSKRLILKHDQLVSNFSFNFHLRRFSEASFFLTGVQGGGGSAEAEEEDAAAPPLDATAQLIRQLGRAVQVDSITTRLEARLVSALEAEM